MAPVQQPNRNAGNMTNGIEGDNSTETIIENEAAELSTPNPSNPYHFPQYMMPSGIFFNGAEAMRFPAKHDPVTHLQMIQDMPMRNDDVIITAYLKCGNHWVAEMLHMLITGKTEFCGRSKEHYMFEFNDTFPMDALPSPRVFNSHLFTAHLPKQIVEKKIKMIHLIRNPKDVAVSLYYHLKQRASDEFTFANFLKGYPTSKYLIFNHQFNFLRQMAEFEKAHPGQPIMHIHYEDLKQDSASIVRELAQFVGVSATDEFCQAVTSACSFSNLKKADANREMPGNLQSVVTGKLNFYRKGIVGDWKNQFTVAQSEMFDRFRAEQEKLGIGYTPKGL